MKTNNEELKRLAEAATPGPWDVAYSEIPHRYGGSHKDMVICTSEIDAQLKGRYPIVCQAVGVGDGDHGPAVKFTHINDENAAYIAAANPAAVLELIRQRDELLAALKDAREMVSDWAGYASPYFQEKHDIDGDLKKLDDAIAKVRG